MPSDTIKNNRYLSSKQLGKPNISTILMLWYRVGQEQTNQKFNKIQEQEDLANQDSCIQQIYASKMKVK